MGVVHPGSDNASTVRVVCKVGNLTRNPFQSCKSLFKTDPDGSVSQETAPLTVLQRLGCMFERVLGRQELADALFETLHRADVTLFRIPLKASASAKGQVADDRWKVIQNIRVELES